MKIKLAVAVLVLVSASAALAQNSPIRVEVIAEESPESHTIADRLSGQIGSSPRYALVTESPTRIMVSVNCLTTNLVNGQQIGIVCNMNLSYWPVSGVPLHTDLTEMLEEASDESDVTQVLFDSFVEQTSDEKLNQETANFKSLLNSTITLYPKGVASLHQSSKVRNTRAKLDATIENPSKKGAKLCTDRRIAFAAPYALGSTLAVVLFLGSKSCVSLGQSHDRSWCGPNGFSSFNHSWNAVVALRGLLCGRTLVTHILVGLIGPPPGRTLRSSTGW